MSNIVEVTNAGVPIVAAHAAMQHVHDRARPASHRHTRVNEQVDDDAPDPTGRSTLPSSWQVT